MCRARRDGFQGAPFCAGRHSVPRLECRAPAPAIKGQLVKILAVIETGAARFNRLSVRERVMIVAATLVAIAALWNMLLMQPLEARRKTLTAQVATLQNSIAAISQALGTGRTTDPTTLALEQIKSAQEALAAVDSKLDATSTGLLAPQRVPEVIHDVLRQRGDVRLISLRTEPVVTLSPQSADGAGPYLHPVELIIEGRYLDILEYLRAMEALRWRLYWRTLELDSTHYPLDRVRIELGTLSLDRTWVEL
jgi:MSHA biogenesis protein MshJ